MSSTEQVKFSEESNKLYSTYLQVSVQQVANWSNVANWSTVIGPLPWLIKSLLYRQSYASKKVASLSQEQSGPGWLQGTKTFSIDASGFMRHQPQIWDQGWQGAPYFSLEIYGLSTLTHSPGPLVFSTLFFFHLSFSPSFAFSLLLPLSLVTPLGSIL